MLQYGSLEGAELALGRNLTVAEKLWYAYSAQKSDYVLYIHSCLFLFLVFSLVPLPWVLVELHRFDAMKKFKVQPRIRKSFPELLKCYKDVIVKFVLVVAPLILVSFPVLKVRLRK
ncbi:sterol-4alpha-methyl oxidase 1-1 [Hibiscus trionum]|uniref:Sterol-4alpha-methyl oxidase 1-1 n=1 Tax=Hibiscus trionum TaxID=183268 RepID=A0A9W7H479_HIBTR|nr:sterol-4alpha-methyl oxidase 1-1 [Hibiscus trionum]